MCGTGGMRSGSGHPDIWGVVGEAEQMTVREWFVLGFVVGVVFSLILHAVLEQVGR